MIIKNYRALLAILLAAGAFLYAHAQNQDHDSVTHAYYTQQIYAFKKLIKTYPQLLQHTYIKSLAAYLKHLFLQNPQLRPEQNILLTPQHYAQFLRLYRAALTLKKQAALRHKHFSLTAAPHLTPARTSAFTFNLDNQQREQDQNQVQTLLYRQPDTLNYTPADNAQEKNNWPYPHTTQTYLVEPDIYRSVYTALVHKPSEQPQAPASQLPVSGSTKSTHYTYSSYTNNSYSNNYFNSFRPHTNVLSIASNNPTDNYRTAFVRSFVDELRATHRELTRYKQNTHRQHRKQQEDEDYEEEQEEDDDDDEIPDPVQEYNSIKNYEGATRIVRQTIRKLPTDELLELSQKMRDKHIIGAYEELAKRFVNTTNPKLHKRQLWLERKIINIHKDRQGKMGFFKSIFRGSLSDGEELKLENLYEQIRDQHKAVNSMRQSINILQNCKFLDPNTQTVLKQYYNNLATDPILKYRLSRNQERFIRQNAANIIHRDIAKTLDEFTKKQYPTQAEEDAVLALTPHLNTREHYLQNCLNLEDKNNTLSCSKALAQQAEAITQKRARLDAFAKQTGIDQSSIRTLERRWEIPYQELTVVYTDGEQTLIHQEIIH